MKKILLLSCLACPVLVQAQPALTYDHFSAMTGQTITCNMAQNSTFNTALLTVTGNGVTWNASGLQVQPGTPNFSLGYYDPATTPHASLYTNANWSRIDPAYTAMMSYEYYLGTPDSFAYVGDYAPSGQHEIFQDPEKLLVFPMSFGQTVNDNYAKTNYSNSTTVSSYQTGVRMLNYNGFGTLILPQGTFTNVALITSTRTNSLGPLSYDYWWYDVSNGLMLMNYHSNNGSTTIAYFNGTPTLLPQPGLSGNKMILLNNGSRQPVLQSFYDNVQPYTLIDMAGKPVARGSIGAYQRLSLELLVPQGMYLLQVGAASAGQQVWKVTVL